MIPETIMFGAKGFRAREAAANYKRRERRLVTDEVRAARFAALYGTETQEVETPKPVPKVEETKVEATSADEAKAKADEKSTKEKKPAKGKA